jgi:hypothetical protein
MAYCTKCGHQVGDDDGFCAKCGAARGANLSNAPGATAATEIAAPSGLVDTIPEKLETLLSEMLEPNETVHIKLKGANREALVCTSKRVLILKAGAVTGHLLGSGAFQTPYRNVTGAQVKQGMLTGYFEISAGGVQNRPTTYGRAVRQENCISLAGKEAFVRFRQASSFILSKCG